jgi:uncharacterized protein (TIGR03067 family)
MIVRSLFVLMVAYLLACNQPGDRSKNEPTALEGTWQLESQETDGQMVPKEVAQMTQLIIQGNQFSTLIGGKPDGATVTFTIDASKNPKELDRTAEYQGKKTVWKSIYELSEDTLRMAAFYPNRDERPKAFDQSGLTVLVYKRLKR